MLFKTRLQVLHLRRFIFILSFLELSQVGLRKLFCIGNASIYVFMTWLKLYNFRKKYTLTLIIFLHLYLEATMQSCHNARE